MADAFASAQDYATRTGQALSTIDQAQITALLDEASALIRLSVPGIDAKIADGVPEMTIVIGLCVRMVARYVANPVQAAALTTGPFTTSWAAANTRGMWIADDELALLNPPTPRTSPGGVGSIRLGTVVGTARPGRLLPPWM